MVNTECCQKCCQNKIKNDNAGGDSSWARGLWMGMSLGEGGYTLENDCIGLIGYYPINFYSVRSATSSTTVSCELGKA
tara:strand:+ start:1325 stop:1558 length:234 start_codon:yes stop_codon:yes gene_type:complete